MICYMPFTYIDDPFIGKLTNALGPVSIYCPNPVILPDHMLAWAGEEMLEPRYPHGLQADHLIRAIQEFKAWADLHQGNIADMAGFFKSQKGCPPMVDETNPTAIGDQIRNFGQLSSREPVDPVFQAGLFLSMAQEYDQQHATVAQELGAVSAMEQAMMDRLVGDDQDVDEMMHRAPMTGNSTGLVDPGAFMTAKRVQAWAELASRDPQPRAYILFVTHSPAVFEYLLDKFPQARGPIQVKVDTRNNGKGASNPEVLETLNTLAFAQDLANRSLDPIHAETAGTDSAELLIYALAGVSPLHFSYRLAGGGSTIDQPVLPPNGPINTLLGLIAA